MVRGSHDFASIDAYTGFVGTIRDKLNEGKPTTLLAEERPRLRPLPSTRLPEYSPYTAIVRQWSTIHFAKKVYSVPSRLIGCEVEVRQYPDVVQVWYRGKLTETMPHRIAERRLRLASRLSRHRLTHEHRDCLLEFVDTTAKGTAPFKDDVLCPCQSRRTVAECSCKARGFVPRPLAIRLPHLFSGQRIRRCYAQETANCGGKITADHAVAQTIHSEMGNGVIERVLRDGRRIETPISSAGRKVLCKRHHDVLSPLEQLGRRFVRAHRDSFLFARNTTPVEDRHVLFNGYDVERWMLKVLCTLAHDQPASRFGASAPWRVPREWVKVLFEGAPLPAGAGLYTPRHPRGRAKTGLHLSRIIEQKLPGVGGLPLIGELGTDGVVGLALCIYGLDLDLRMAQPVESDDAFRVRMYRQPTATGSFYIHLGWEDSPPAFLGKVFSRGDLSVRDDLLRN